MKIAVLFISVFAYTSVMAQPAVSGFYGQIANSVVDGTNHRTYFLMTTPFSQFTGGPGAGMLFFYYGFEPSIVLEYDNVLPNEDEVNEYPGTNKVIVQSGYPEDVKTYINTTGNTVSYTGTTIAGFKLNYMADNATLGTFAIGYPHSQVDTSSGTYTYGEISGNFIGTISGKVQAYGMFYSDDFGYGAFNAEPISVFEVQQDIVLEDSSNSNAGTIQVRNLYYFRSGDKYPVYNMTITTINVPMLSINESSTIYEMARGSEFLNNPDLAISGIMLYPNPVNTILTIEAPSQVAVTSVTITDTNGRIITIKNSGFESIDLSLMAKGIYFAKIETDSGTVTKKIIKE